MNIRSNQERDNPLGENKGSESHRFAQNFRKEPLKIFPIHQNNEDSPINSYSLNTFSCAETPRLKEPDNSAILNSSVLSEIEKVTSSDNQSSSSLRRHSKLCLKLKFNSLKNTKNALQLSSRTSSANLTSENNELNRSSARDIQPRSSLATGMCRVVVETPEICKFSEGRYTNRSASLTNRSFSGIDDSKDRIDEQSITDQKSVLVENPRSTNSQSARRTSCHEFDSKRSFSVYLGKDSGSESKCNGYSILSGSVSSKRPMTSRSVVNRNKDDSMVSGVYEGPKSYRAKVEAYFWDPNESQRDLEE